MNLVTLFVTPVENVAAISFSYRFFLIGSFPRQLQITVVVKLHNFTAF